MSEHIDETVSVITIFNHEKGTVLPREIKWRGRVYHINKLGYHHAVRQGRMLLHIFHVTDGTNDFRLLLNTENLHWTLQEMIPEV